MKDIILAILPAFTAGVLSIFSGIITGTIVGNRKLDKISDKVLEISEHKDLTRDYQDVIKGQERLLNDHHGLSGDHHQLFDDHKSILGRIDDAKAVALTVKELVSVAKDVDSIRYENLTEKQKTIIVSLKELDAFAEELKIAITDNKRLKEDNQKLESENKALKRLIKMQSRQNRDDLEYESER